MRYTALRIFASVFVLLAADGARADGTEGYIRHLCIQGNSRARDVRACVQAASARGALPTYRLTVAVCDHAPKLYGCYRAAVRWLDKPELWSALRQCRSVSRTNQEIGGCLSDLFNRLALDNG
jgi:hypothetical protein